MSGSIDVRRVLILYRSKCRMLKKPTGSGLSDISKEGYQEQGIDEGIIYGGAFEEDSGDGCVSL